MNKNTCLVLKNLLRYILCEYKLTIIFDKFLSVFITEFLRFIAYTFDI